MKPLTIEDILNNKKIIEKRLKGNNVSEYLIDLDEKTGKITIEIPENSQADEVQSIIGNSGSFILLDGETFEVVFVSSFETVSFLLVSTFEDSFEVFFDE